jgi:hypothetical protein
MYTGTQASGGEQPERLLMLAAHERTQAGCDGGIAPRFDTNVVGRIAEHQVNGAAVE